MVLKLACVWDGRSAAATLFHLASGRLPFPCARAVDASVHIAGDLDLPPPDVRDAAPAHLRAGVSAVFAEALRRAMMRRRERRLGTVDELAEALHGCLVQRGEDVYSAFISYRVASEQARPAGDCGVRVQRGESQMLSMTNNTGYENMERKPYIGIFC